MNRHHFRQSTFWERVKATKSIRIGSILAILLVLVCLVPISIARPAGAIFSTSNPIKHIVIMVKENRSFDDLFGTFPGANGATTYKDPHGKIHPLNHQPDRLFSDIAHDHPAFLNAYDHGKMDGFSKIVGAIQYINGKKVDEADSQFYQSDIPNYWQYAQTFALPDNFFYAVRSDSFPNHLFTIAGEDDDVAGLPSSNQGLNIRWGCDAPKASRVKEIHPNGKVSHVFPCFSDFQTMGDLLSANNISWKYYAPGQDQNGYQYSTYDAIKDIRETQQWKQHVFDYTLFAKDAAAGKLPTVSWLVQPDAISDHPGASMCAGENWTVSQINAIMQNSALWQSTAILLTWDDFGGVYDHVVPPVGPNKYLEYGFRAPLILISPYTKPHYIDHTQYTFPSMLKFVETVLHLPSLGGLDKSANDLVHAFNFNQKPLSPLILKQRTCPKSSDGPVAHFLDQS